MQSYDYANREGVEDISWERFASLVKTLTEKLAAEQVDVVVGIARAGLIPAATVACELRKEMFPVRVSRRKNDTVTYDHPVWRTDVSRDVAGKTVAVIDEIADTGETLSLVADRVRDYGATRIITATLTSHSWANPAPDHTALITDALVIFPWDKEVFTDGRWETHPEIVDALRRQAGKDT